MRSAIDGRLISDKFPDSVHRDPVGSQVVKYDRKLIFIQGFIDIRDVTMEHIVFIVVFNDDDAVAVGMAFGFDHMNTIDYFL